MSKQEEYIKKLEDIICNQKDEIDELKKDIKDLIHDNDRLMKTLNEYVDDE